MPWGWGASLWNKLRAQLRLGVSPAEGPTWMYRMYLQRLTPGQKHNREKSALTPIITEWKGMRRQGQPFLKGALGRDETSGIWKFHPDIGKIYFWFVFVL